MNQMSIVNQGTQGSSSLTDTSTTCFGTTSDYSRMWQNFEEMYFDQVIRSLNILPHRSTFNRAVKVLSFPVREALIFNEIGVFQVRIDLPKLYIACRALAELRKKKCGP